MATSIPGCAQAPPVFVNDSCRKVNEFRGGVNALFIGSSDVTATILDVTNATQWETANTNLDMQVIWKIKGEVSDPAETSEALSGDESESITSRERTLTAEWFHNPYDAVALINSFNANVSTFQLAYQVGQATGTNYVRSWICGAQGGMHIVEGSEVNGLVKVMIKITWVDFDELNADIMPSVDI